MLLTLNHLKWCLCCLHSIILSSACAAHTWSPWAVLIISDSYIFLVLLDSCLTLSLFSEIWFFKLLSSLFMSNQCIKKLTSFMIHCYKLAGSLTLSSEMMWLCKECVSQSLSCHVGLKSFKCVKCAAHTLQKYDLVISETEWVKVQCECTCICIKLCLKLLSVCLNCNSSLT